jgi:predicted N-formylglutamate amidohydrolase
MKGAASSRRLATDSPPFLLHDPGSVGPVLLLCEHAANGLPFRAGIGAAARGALRTHWGWDIGAWPLALDLAARLGTTAIGGRWSRLLVDLNRRVDDPTLVRRRAGSVVLPWNDGIDAGEIERRALAYHAPYHGEVDRLIVRRLLRGVRPLLLAVHTFTPRLGRSTRRFEIGILYAHDRELARRLGRALGDTGLRVRFNQPYSGRRGMMYSAERHASHHHLPCLEVEVNQRLFRRPGAVPRLGESIASGVASLVGSS